MRCVELRVCLYDEFNIWASFTILGKLSSDRNDIMDEAPPRPHCDSCHVQMEMLKAGDVCTETSSQSSDDDEILVSSA